MTIGEKEQVMSEAIQRLVKNKGLDLKINKMGADSLCFNVALDYVVNGKEKRQQFGFVSKGFDPNYFEFSGIKDLQIPTNLNDYQKVVLKLAYYFYNGYKLECN